MNNTQEFPTIELEDLPVIRPEDLPDSYLSEDVDISYLEHPRAKYSKEIKIQAIGLFFETASTRKVAEALGVSQKLVDEWKNKSPWWDDILYSLRKDKQKELDALLTNTIHKALFHVNDRLENGDWIHDGRSGELKRVPMKGKEIAITLAVMYDKRALIRGEATSIKQESKATLQSLASTFESFADKLDQQKEKNVISTQ